VTNSTSAVGTVKLLSGICVNSYRLTLAVIKNVPNIT
jgi:hypothetical protein